MAQRLDISAVAPLLSHSETIPAAPLIPCHAYVIILDFAELQRYLLCKVWFQEELWPSSCLFPLVQSFLPGIRSKSNLCCVILPYRNFLSLQETEEWF